MKTFEQNVVESIKTFDCYHSHKHPHTQQTFFDIFKKKLLFASLAQPIVADKSWSEIGIPSSIAG